MYQIKRTTRFKKDYELAIKRGCKKENLVAILQLLVNGSTIPEKYRDHPLRNTNEYKDCRELHIEPDWLLVYKYSNDKVILYLIRTGTHSDLFDKR